MSELLVYFDNKGPSIINKEINIEASLNIDECVEYKFIEGFDKVWTPIQDFSEENICKWTPQKSGKYMLLVQGKVKGSTKPYDYLGRAEYEVKDDTKLIKTVNVEKSKVKIGDKVTLSVDAEEDLLLYRFWIRNNSEWQPLRDYTTENEYVFTATETGGKEILIECKRVSSDNNVDDYTRVKIDVSDLSKIEINKFQCLSNKLLVNEELVFKVETTITTTSTLLYKFYKFGKDGRASCIQDYSSKSTVSFKEQEAGEYKLLCLVRDIFSNKEYNDRAVLNYKVEPYEKISIKSFKGDLESPQAAGTTINLKSVIDGGREVLYRYIIEGPTCEDTGYIRNPNHLWKTSEEGKYNITLKVKDISFKGDYEDIISMMYNIDKKGEKPIRIVDVKCESGKHCLVGQPINLTISIDGGSKPLYKFIVYKDGVQKDEVDYVKSNWVNFTPEEKGEYEIEIRVKDFYSLKEYDSSASFYINATDYIPANIDYLLTKSKEIYLVKDTIEIEAIMQNTKDVMVKFVTKINGREVENTGFVDKKAIRVKPKCPGKYTFHVFAKNIKSSAEFDSEKEISIYVQDATPVNSTKVLLLSDEIKVGKEVEFEVKSEGGRDVCYEFYIMKDNNWVLVQEYSKKSYYSFVPFTAGEYRLLVLSKSYFKKINYEDYTSVNFNVIE